MVAMDFSVKSMQVGSDEVLMKQAKFSAERDICDESKGNI